MIEANLSQLVSGAFGSKVNRGVKDEGDTGGECAQGMPGPGRGSLGGEDQGLTMTSVIPVL